MEIYELITVLTGIFLVSGVMLFLISFLLFCYLEIRNTDNSIPYFRLDFAILTTYSKPVQKRDLKIKNFRNKVHSISGYSFLIGGILFLITIIFK